MARLPMCLIVDDPAPIINPLYYFRLQVTKMAEPKQQSGEPMPPKVPLELLQRFAQAAEKFGVKGKFSILAYPAGLGSILDGWEGADRKELEAWLRIARERIAPLFDITPEIHTHTLALNLETKKMLPLSEHEWSQQQNEETLTRYIGAALDILRRAGFDATGVTSPCDFGKKVEEAYARAVLNAERKVYGRKLTWYFLHTDTDPKGKASHVFARDGTDGAVVSVVSKCGDFAWQTMESPETSEEYVRSVADKYVTEDGSTGHLAALLNAGAPIVFHTHWQSLFSNGRFTGMCAVETMFERVARLWKDRAEWMKCSTFAERIMRNP